MRIVHTEASCGWGGQELRILSEAAGLIERGHWVSLLCPPEARIFTEAPHAGVPVQALPIARRKPGGMFALRRWISHHRPDVINTHSSTDAWLVAAACRTLRRPPPMVRTRHISAPIPTNPPTRWLYCSATSRIVTTGDALRRELIERNGFPPAQIVSVPTGIDPRRFFPGDRSQARIDLGLDPCARYLGIVATLRSWKGHLYLLEAVARLPSPWRLLVVGDGPMRSNIEARIGELGLRDRVVLAGHRDDPERWLRCLDIFCLPSYANEGVPQAIVQAMLTGLPVVSTPVGSIAEAIRSGSSGLLVPAKDVPRLAAAISRLIDDPQLGARFGAAAREQALARFTRSAMLDAMEALFREVVRG